MSQHIKMPLDISRNPKLTATEAIYGLKIMITLFIVIISGTIYHLTTVVFVKGLFMTHSKML